MPWPEVLTGRPTSPATTDQHFPFPQPSPHPASSSSRSFLPSRQESGTGERDRDGRCGRRPRAGRSKQPLPPQPKEARKLVRRRPKISRLPRMGWRPVSQTTRPRARAQTFSFSRLPARHHFPPVPKPPIGRPLPAYFIGGLALEPAPSSSFQSLASRHRICVRAPALCPLTAISLSEGDIGGRGGEAGVAGKGRSCRGRRRWRT